MIDQGITIRTGCGPMPTVKMTASEARVYVRHSPNAGLTKEQADWFRRHMPDSDIEQFALNVLRT